MLGEILKAPRWVLALTIAAFLSSSFAPSYSNAAINTVSGKYAALIMDSDSGEVLFARNADTIRHPASLTKMMTLYLLFESMKAGKTKLTDRLKVSARAASQPQTNLSLRTGQTIPVKDAINALVIRSANDVAVVVAEALGKTEWNFGLLMTAKARKLGMSKTVFLNPHGLPNVKQVTTASDMAKLGIALKRDFPEFYPYFKTQRFTYAGVTYTTHNRVMTSYDGVDGIKTGYINMSGFNLVTSAHRDGYNLVGVVLGGQTAYERDEHMKALLTKNFTILAERGDEPRRYAVVDAPKPLSKPNWDERQPKVDKPFPVAEINRDTRPRLTFNSTKKEAAFLSHPDSVVPTAKPSASSNTPWIQASFKSSATPQGLQRELSSVGQSLGLSGEWGIQVGAYSDVNSAKEAATKAVKSAYEQLKNSKVAVTDKADAAKTVHRARLANLSEVQAKKACARLQSQNTPCFVYRDAPSSNL